MTAASPVSSVVVGGTVRGLAPRTARGAVERVLRDERTRARVAVTFVGRARMRRLNAQYLGHDRPTDVLAFALPQPDGSLAGDIYICPDVAAAAARAHRIPLREELVRLVVHGTLHLVGWDHPAGDDRATSPMWRRQERYVAALA